MSECIAMAIGFVLGAGCVMLAQMQKEKCKMQNYENDGTMHRVFSAKDTGTEAPEDEKDGERDRLQKQWENFLNYNGTEEGQMLIGDE